jgi:hypothetical protein
LIAMVGMVSAICIPRFAFCYRHADLRNADLSNALLEGLDLRFAQITGANLDNANLNSADLRGISIDSSTKIDPKWRRVICLLQVVPNPYVDPDCAKLAGLEWVDLSHARLSGLDLRGASLVGANLKGADLTTSNLDEADLRLADLTNASLPRLQGVHLDGAVGGSPRSSTPIESEYIAAAFTNRISEACIDERIETLKPSHLFTVLNCLKNQRPNRAWRLQRLTNGYFNFLGATSKGKFCLDGSAITEHVPVRMYQCSRLNDTQYWKVDPKTPTFVSLEENGRGLCINGGDLKRTNALAYLQNCDGYNHDQQWQINIAAVPPPVHTSVIVAHIKDERDRDAALAAREYKVSPGSRLYGARNYQGRRSLP